MSDKTSLRFSINPKHSRDPKHGEYYYRIELSDGREAVVLAEDIIVDGSGGLRCVTDGSATVVLPAGVWQSAYMCEAILAHDPWSILYLAAPPSAKKSAS